MMRHLSGGRYELRARLGRGAGGDVFRAVERGPFGERDVCIKRLSGTMPPESVAALREEARLLSRVRHANVLTLYDIGEDDRDAPFLVLELIDGLDLRGVSEALKQTPDPRLPARVAVHVACGVLRGLAAVQRALPGLVHRDVTPHNVLVSREGEVKLADFGIALAADRVRWTRPSHVKGKYGFMAPEQVRGEVLDPRCDLFALGVILYDLLAGVRPCHPLRGMKELGAIAHGELMPLRERVPSVERELAAVVDRLLAHERDRRFATADDALRALAPFGAGDLGSLRLASILRTMAHSVPEPLRAAATRGETPAALHGDSAVPARASSPKP